MTVNKWRLGAIELGSSSLTASLRERRIQVAPFQGEIFGGMVKPSLDIDLKGSQPQTRFAGNVGSFNFGQALQVFGVTGGIGGSADMDVTVLGHGTNLQEFLKGLTLKLRTNHITWGFADSISKNSPHVTLHQLSLGVSKGGPMEIAVKGTFQKKAFGARLMTASPIELIERKKPWPVSLTARMSDAVLAAKGTLNTESPEMGGTVSVSLKGKKLNELYASLPPAGPYHFMAQITKEGSRYRMHDFQSRFGTSDLSGTLEVEIGKGTPQLTGDRRAPQF